jgi:hypothetical protein
MHFILCAFMAELFFFRRTITESVFQATRARLSDFTSRFLAAVGLTRRDSEQVGRTGGLGPEEGEVMLMYSLVHFACSPPCALLCRRSKHF